VLELIVDEILIIFGVDFQLTYARREWAEERAAWRSVIFLNFVRNVNLVVEHLNGEMSDYPVVNHDDSQEDLHQRARALPRLKFNDEHRRLRSSLSRLTETQLELEGRLGSATLEIQSTTVVDAAPFYDGSSSTASRRGGEFSIHSSNGWKTALEKFKIRTPGQGNSHSRPDLGDGERESNGSGNGSPVATSPTSLRESREWEDSIGYSLEQVREDIKALWEDSTVQEVLVRRKVRLEDMPGL
jgi:guanine nucleotide-binding protein subunit alpha